MKKIFNIKAEFDNIEYEVTDEDLCLALEKRFSEELGDDAKHVNIKVDSEDKDQRIAELEEEIEKKKEDLNWYSMWHKNFNEQIKKLTDELETYRPTKLTGDGQCSCYGCEQKEGFNRHWTSSCYRYKGHDYCSECLKDVLGKEQNIELKRLQEENAKLKDKIDAFNYAKNTVDYWACRDKKVKELQEQLKNAIVPKYKVGDEVFVNLTDMDFVKKTFCLKISGIDYRYILETRPYGRFDERDLFDTEAEAQKYLEEHK